MRLLSHAGSVMSQVLLSCDVCCYNGSLRMIIVIICGAILYRSLGTHTPLFRTLQDKLDGFVPTHFFGWWFKVRFIFHIHCFCIEVKILEDRENIYLYTFDQTSLMKMKHLVGN